MNVNAISQTAAAPSRANHRHEGGDGFDAVRADIATLRAALDALVARLGEQEAAPENGADHHYAPYERGPAEQPVAQRPEEREATAPHPPAPEGDSPATTTNPGQADPTQPGATPPMGEGLVLNPLDPAFDTNNDANGGGFVFGGADGRPLFTLNLLDPAFGAPRTTPPAATPPAAAAPEMGGTDGFTGNPDGGGAPTPNPTGTNTLPTVFELSDFSFDALNVFGPGGGETPTRRSVEDARIQRLVQSPYA